jgi:hypothetical protein
VVEQARSSDREVTLGVRKCLWLPQPRAMTLGFAFGRLVLASARIRPTSHGFGLTPKGGRDITGVLLKKDTSFERFDYSASRLRCPSGRAARSLSRLITGPRFDSPEIDGE